MNLKGKMPLALNVSRFLMGIIISGFIFPSHSFSNEPSEYRNPLYGFSFIPYQGLKMDEAASIEGTETLRREDKNAFGVVFMNPPPEGTPGDLDLIFPDLLLSFRPPERVRDPILYSERRLDDLKKEIPQYGRKDPFFNSKTLVVDGYPASQLIFCTRIQTEKPCLYVNHITEIYAPQGDFRLLFIVLPEEYEELRRKIEKSINSIDIAPNVPPPSSPPCEKSDILVLSLEWREGGEFIKTVDLRWKARVKNRSEKRCIIKVNAEFLDENKKVIFSNPKHSAVVLESLEEKNVMNLHGSIELDLIPKIKSQRLVIKEVK